MNFKNSVLACSQILDKFNTGLHISVDCCEATVMAKNSHGEIMISKCEMQCDDFKRITVDGFLFSKFFKNIDSDVRVEKNGNSLIILTSSGTYEFGTFYTDEIIVEDSSFSLVEIKDFKQFLTAFKCSSKEEVKRAMTGVCLSSNDVFATDGFRAYLGFDGISGVVGEVIIPNFALTRLQKFNNPELHITSDGFAVFSEKEITYFCPTVNERFPPIRNIVPRGTIGEFEVETSKLIGVLKRASIYSNSCAFYIDSSAMSVKAENKEDSSKMEEQLSVEASISNNFKIGFNVNLLIELLLIINTKNVKFAVSSLDGNKPVLFDKFLIMPLRIME